MQNLEKMLLPRSDAAALVWKPPFGPTRLLAAALWLKLKKCYFKEATSKEACSLFNVRPKQLSKILSGKKYTGGTEKCKAEEMGPHLRQKKQKSATSTMAIKRPDKGDDSDNNDGGH